MRRQPCGKSRTTSPSPSSPTVLSNSRGGGLRIGSSFARRLHVESLEDRRMLAVFTVDNLDDFAVFGSGEAPGTLRQAIFDANDTPGDDLIEFDPGLFGTIFLEHGELTINSSTTIAGPGAHVLAIDALQNSRVFNSSTDELSPVINVIVGGLTLRGGHSDTDGGAVHNGAYSYLTITDCLITDSHAVNGGGIAQTSGGSLRVERTTILDNSADGLGGGLFSQSQFAVVDSTVSGNQAGYGGGGLCISEGYGDIWTSTIQGNTASYGGGVYNRPNATLSVVRSTISGNVASLHGGGIYNWFGFATVTDTTISGNEAQENGGGIISIEGSLVVTRSTVTLNIADSDNNGTGEGGGIRQFDGDIGQTAALYHTIIADNFNSNGFVDLSGAFTASYTLIGDNTGANLHDVVGNIIGTSESRVDPRLRPLAHNGGPTMTHRLLDESPAIDAGDTSLIAGFNVPNYDQRGFPHTRVFDGNADLDEQIDIGAFEYDYVIFTVDLIVDESDGDFSSGDLSLREAIEQAALVTQGSPVVRFDAVLFNGGPATIVLNFNEQLDITASMDIEGPGADLLTVEVQNFGRAFSVDDFQGGTISDVSISGLTISGGNNPNGGGAIFSRERLIVAESVITGNTAQWGGAIYNDTASQLTVVNSEISGNTATSSGGAIYNWGGVVLVFDSLITGNDSDTAGGGVLNANSGSVAISRSTVSGNDAATDGGGLFNGSGSVHIEDSTFSGNTADRGGAVHAGSPTADIVIIRNSTISGNVAPLGGAGVFNYSGHVVIQFSTVTQNDSNDFAGSGVVTWGDTSFAFTEIYSTIVAGNHHTDVAVTGGFVDTFESLGYNVIGTGSVDAFDDPGDYVIEMTDPGLGPLADNGGPTWTHALLPGSPAIDQGDSSLASGEGGVPHFDQRFVGFDRVRDGNGDSSAVIDVGAFELAAIPASADFDGDGDVDGRDFLAWQRGYGTSMAAKQEGDADNDGNVNGADLAVWQEQYGTPPPQSTFTASLLLGEVKSPTLVGLVSQPVNARAWEAAVDAALVLIMDTDAQEHEIVEDEWAPGFVAGQVVQASLWSSQGTSGSEPKLVKDGEDEDEGAASEGLDELAEPVLN